jgi:hypothetical protein
MYDLTSAAMAGGQDVAQSGPAFFRQRAQDSNKPGVAAFQNHLPNCRRHYFGVLNLLFIDIQPADNCACT